MPRVERPLAAGDGPLLRFAADLRKLRERAGNPVYRELSRRAHYSPAALSEAAGGRRLPSLPVTLAYVAACDGDVTEWERRWREVTAELSEPVEHGEPADAPYVGLSSFRVSDAERFFGREELVAELADRVSGRRFVGLFGPSGSGKSSILRAGLVAQRGDLPTILFTPGRHPIEECAVRLATFLGESPSVLRREFTADPADLRLRIRQALADRGDDADLLLVVDQFEEVFTLCPDRAEQDAFIDALLAASAGPARVVIGVRADFYGHCARHQGLVAALRDAQVLVGPMTAEELRRAITQPAVLAGCMVSTALVARVVSDVAGEVAALPMVSHALLETWRRRQGTTLTLAGYEAVGGIHHALARTAEQVYAGLTPDQQRTARRLFLRLIALGDGTEDTKRRVPGRELDADPATKAVLDALVDARLLTMDTDGVELAHEALIRHWPRLRDWLAEDREGLRIHRRLTLATDDWEALGRDPGALYQGVRLESAAEWAGRQDDVTVRERAFLDASLSARRRRTLRLRQVAALLSVLLLVAVSATVYAVHAERTATEQRNVALSQKLLGLTSLRAANPALALQLTVAAYRLDPSPAARDSVLSALAAPYAAQVSVGNGAALSTALSPRRDLLVAGGDDGAVTLFDVSDAHHPAELATLPGHRTAVMAVAFNPAGTLIATAGADQVVRLWDVSDPRQPRQRAELAGHAGMVASVSFSPDGRLLASGGYDDTARLWDVDTAHQLSVIPGSGGVVSSVAFAPDGKNLATANYDNTARLWGVGDPGHPAPGAVLAGHAGVLTAVAFDPAGNIVATAGDDATIRLWNAADGTPLAVLRGHANAVMALAFSPDGQTLASGGADKTARLWDVASGRESWQLNGHSNAVSSVAFGPDGHTLATASTDKTVRLEDLTPVLAKAAVTAIAVSGNRAVTGGRDGATRLLDVSEPSRPRVIATFRGGSAPVNAVAFDGRQLSTVDRTGLVRTWDAGRPDAPRSTYQAEAAIWSAFSADGRELAGSGIDGAVRLRRDGRPATLPSQGATATAVAFSRDGKLLASGGADDKIRIWDVERSALLATLTGHTDVVNTLAFAPDGRTLASGSVDDTVRLWDLRAQKAVFTGHTDAVEAVSFSADGKSLVSGGADDTVRVWDVGDPTRAVVLTGHADTVNAVAFAPDGRTVLSGGDDTVRLWDTDVEQTIGDICARAWPRLSEADWQRYLPGVDYQPPCP
jgi:WD40 repeat protein